MIIGRGFSYEEVVKLDGGGFKPCGTCGGLGTIGNDPAVECPNCDGYGYVPEVEDGGITHEE
jgi:DnaJ-class molecular chaperone